MLKFKQEIREQKPKVFSKKVKSDEKVGKA